MTLKVAALGLPPYFFFNPDGSFSGIDLDVIGVLADKFQFSVEIEPAEEWFNIKTDENGEPVMDEYGQPELVGAIAQVHYGKATFVISEMILFEEGFMLCDYVFIYSVDLRYRTGSPKPIAPVWNIMKPFKIMVWITVLCVLMMTMVIFALFATVTDGHWIENALSIFGHQISQGTKTVTDIDLVNTLCSF